MFVDSPRRSRGRPRKDIPAGTWIDSDVLGRRIASIVGTRDERADDGAHVLDALCRFARRLLGRRLTQAERDRLRTLALVRRAKASVIVRQLVAWRHGIGERDVRRMHRSLREASVRDSTRLVLKYEADRPLLDADGKLATNEDGEPILVRPPVCDEEGQPILWVPDEHGQPTRPYVAGEPLPSRSATTVRPRAKMIYR